MKKHPFLLALALLILGVFWVLWANTAIEVNEWKIESPELPESFDGFRIAHISDLHNAEFGAENRRLLRLLEGCGPDIIVLTGDLIDSQRTDIGIALDFVAEAGKLAPCYYVSGNHESRIGQWQTLRQGLIDAGVTVLEDRKVTLEHSGEQIALIGMSDPDFGGPFADTLQRLTAAEEGYTILLSHRPESFGLYAHCGVDLTFSGHAHGGQVRIPLIGGLIAPHQGFSRNTTAACTVKAKAGCWSAEVLETASFRCGSITARKSLWRCWNGYEQIPLCGGFVVYIGSGFFAGI